MTRPRLDARRCDAKKAAADPVEPAGPNEGDVGKGGGRGKGRGRGRGRGRGKKTEDTCEGDTAGDEQLKGKKREEATAAPTDNQQSKRARAPKAKADPKTAPKRRAKSSSTHVVG